MMLTPDLLDRRALAELALTDGFGRPLRGAVTVTGTGVRVVGKSEGRIAILAAAGFEAYAASFAAPPMVPAVGSQSLTLDLTPADPLLLPRRLVLKLPRDPDPAASSGSLFQSVSVPLSASPRVGMTGTACILRASVHRASDGAFVENALVRVQSADGAFAAWALTDAAGEAALVLPALPVSFAGAGGTTSATISGAVIVHADPASVRFANPSSLVAARLAAAVRLQGHADPDAIIAAHGADFSGGVSVPLAAGTQPSVNLALAP
jgi:hypothetical protein